MGLCPVGQYNKGITMVDKGAWETPLAYMWEWTSCYKPSNCGNTLKQFQPSESSNTSRGVGNDSRYGKIT